jgi:hypothetical protein
MTVSEPDRLTKAHAIGVVVVMVEKGDSLDVSVGFIPGSLQCRVSGDHVEDPAALSDQALFMIAVHARKVDGNPLADFI